MYDLEWNIILAVIGIGAIGAGFWLSRSIKQDNSIKKIDGDKYTRFTPKKVLK